MLVIVCALQLIFASSVSCCIFNDDLRKINQLINNGDSRGNSRIVLFPLLA